MKNIFKYKLLFCISLIYYLPTTAQWSRKDIAWNTKGLSYRNYRLIHSNSKDDIKIGAVTGSLPAMDASVVNVKGKKLLRITVSNHFNYTQSWMLKSEVKNAALLKHEQGHFDITEIYTRKIFQQLRDFNYTNNYKNETYSIMSAINEELKQVQQEYEMETVYGSDGNVQEKWNAKIAHELATIPSYEGKTIEQILPNK